MYCPRCGCEYREGFYICSDCNIDLVFEKPIVEENNIYGNLSKQLRLLNYSRYFKNFLQVILAVASGIILSVVYLYFIFENCVTIYEAMLPDRDNFYSQIARFTVALPAIVFTIINILFFMYSKKRYKVYAYSYLLLTVLIILVSLLFVRTRVVNGI